jgi:hypothetical protein
VDAAKVFTPQGGVWSEPIFAAIFQQWRDWRESGIPPTSEWKGRGAQNPNLLRAFAVLDEAKSRREHTPAQQTESPAAFAARVKREVANG